MLIGVSIRLGNAGDLEDCRRRCLWLGRCAGQPKHAGEKFSSDSHFHTLHTPSTRIVQKTMKPKQASAHDVTKAAGPQQTGSWVGTAASGILDQHRLCEGSIRLPVAFGGPAN